MYPALGGVDRGSISERGGRYAPEFLWNTNWKDQLELEQACPSVPANPDPMTVLVLPDPFLTEPASHIHRFVCRRA